MIRVCLQQVRPDTRRDAAYVCAQREADEQERSALILAALFPSDQVYYLPDSVRPIFEQVAA